MGMMSQLIFRYGATCPSRKKYHQYVKFLLFSKNNKVALVTGSLSGIGLGIAHSLAAKGYNIILNGFASDEEIRKTTQDFNKRYPNVEAFFIYADLTKAADCKKIVDETLQKYGRVDVLVNNAGKNDDIKACNLSAALLTSQKLNGNKSFLST